MRQHVMVTSGKQVCFCKEWPEQAKENHKKISQNLLSRFYSFLLLFWRHLRNNSPHQGLPQSFHITLNHTTSASFYILSDQLFTNRPFARRSGVLCRLRLKCDGTRAETRFRLSAKRTSPFKSAGASVQSTTGSRGVRIRGSNAGYTMFRSSVKATGYPLQSPVSPFTSPPAPPCAITFQLDYTTNTIVNFLNRAIH
jgi:hypothetical protein